MCAPHMYVHRCIYMCLPMHVHTQMHIHVCPLHVQTQVYILMHPMHIHTQGAYMCAFHACMCTPVFQGCVWVPTWHTWSRAVFTLWCFSALCLWILPLARVSPGYRPLTLLGEFCLCSRRQQGCAATGTPLLRGRPQTGALPPCPCTCVTIPQNELLLPAWLQLTNLGGCLKEAVDSSCLCLGLWSWCGRHHRVI